ncbi:MAG TPA: ABC transporter permease subunit [Xanthobacteraceae bacterium]|nr:ABC transporter permease subunit [Xanthobacteraceae bacterium]
MSAVPAFLNNRRVRDVLWQIAVFAAVAGLLAYFVRNASDNMAKAGIASGFDFLGRTAGIELPFLLTGYTAQSSILELLWAGIVNTMAVSLVAILAATVLGFVIGIARLSRNWLLSNLAGAYVEVVRNIPVLFFVLFWYFAVIAALPGPREAIGIFSVAFLSNRGLTVPTPLAGGAFAFAALAILIAIAAQIAVAAWARRRRARTGRGFPTGGSGAVLVVGVPLVALAAAVAATPWDVPVLRGFNYRGGFVLVPEFVALVAALATYAAAFIAEIVRGGILAVPKGQVEAARALGLGPGQVLRLVVIPQALRVIVPPLTSQYLNVLKNSSLGAAIGFPELMNVFVGSALNITGQAVEIIAVTLAIYLAIGLAVSALMNWYNARIALVTQ